ncbi:MAG: hypothetical protein WBV25_10120, partial [Methylocella sp.]
RRDMRLGQNRANAFDRRARVGEIADYENLLAGVKLDSLRIWMRFNESMTESMSRKSCSIFSILT